MYKNQPNGVNLYVPEDVSYGEAADRRQTPRPAGVPMVGGPHLDDDEGENSGVLRGADTE